MVEHGAALALSHELRSLDALQLAAALVLPQDDSSWPPGVDAFTLQREQRE